MINKLIRKGLELPIFIFTFISKVLISASDLYVSFLRFILRKDYRFERRLAKGVYEIFDDLKKNIVHTTTKGLSIPLVFYTPNAICKIRAETFSTKEPEILQWIDENGDDKPFWDIGACIGLYSIYFAKSCPGRVVSFEPSFFNLKQLAKNIFINKVY
jgi:Na+-transporting NADH:ubiquinone oxidoreductase subunit NqrD